MGNADGHLLEYNGEETANAPLVYAEYSAEWLPFLLGVVKILKQEKIWTPGSDYSALVGEVNDLMWRLMGGDGVGENLGFQAPMLFPATALPWWAATGPTFYRVASSNYLNNLVLTNGTDAEGVLFSVSAYLPAGTYILEVVADKANNRGKFSALCSDTDFNFPLTDCYAASPTNPFVFASELEIEVPALYSWTFSRKLKNVSSSACYLAIAALNIRYKTDLD